LTLPVVDFAVLAKFTEFEIFALGLADSLEVSVNHALAVLY
jgi:hypothetical protein